MKAVHGDVSRVVHRLESFSDIVIGFALAQSALTLVIPPNTIDFYRHPVGIVGYLLTFAIIARFWWLLTEIFRLYFSPSRLTIFLNFAALASLGLFVFSLQLWLHPNQSPFSQNFMAKAYFTNTAITFALLAILRLLGVRARLAQLTAQERQHGIIISLRGLCVSAGVLAGAFATPLNSLDQGSFYIGVRVAALPLDIGIGALAGAVAGRVLALALKKRDWSLPEKVSVKS